MNFLQSNIELSSLSIQQREGVFKQLAFKGLFVAVVGGKVQGCGGMGYLTNALFNHITYGGRPVVTIGAGYRIPSCSHGCKACPHDCSGKIISGLPNVMINGHPVAVAGSEGCHSACCGANSGRIIEGVGVAGHPQTIAPNQLNQTYSQLLKQNG